MFRFENPEYLYLFIALPFLVLLYIYLNIKKQRDVKKLGVLDTLKKMMPELSLRRSYLKFWLIFAALSVGIIVVARPQFGTKVEKNEKEGIELVIAFDVSNSMIARDVKPDRLTRAKQILSHIIDMRKNDKTALVVFAGEAYVQMPITSDSYSAKMFLKSIDPSLVPIQGTDIGAAINLSIDCFSGDKNIGKAIVLITDAEDHEGELEKAIKRAKDMGISINVMGIGTPEGAPLPENQNSNKFRSDSEGKVIVTKLNEAIAENIAKQAKGLYVLADNSNGALRALEKQLNALTSKKTSSVTYSDYDEKFPIFAWILFVILIVEVLIYDKKNPIFKNIRLFK